MYCGDGSSGRTVPPRPGLHLLTSTQQMIERREEHDASITSAPSRKGARPEWLHTPLASKGSGLTTPGALRILERWIVLRGY